MSDKPKMIEISPTWAAEIAERSAAGDLDVPHLVEKIYVDADQWRAWRASQCTSDSKHKEIL
jgi:hypothetical protein